MKSRYAVSPSAFPALLAVLLLAGCGSEPATPAAAAAVGAAPPATEATGTGTGSLGFELASITTLELPVTYCAGAEAIYTVAANQGETQVDFRIVEHPVMRDGAPLEEVTQASMRRNGSAGGRDYLENWASTTITTVSRDGDETRISGRMQGQRMYANGDGSFTSPEPIDQGAERDFSLVSRCSP